MLPSLAMEATTAHAHGHHHHEMPTEGRALKTGVAVSAILLVIPGAMEAGLGDLLFWGSLSFALFIAFLAALPVNRWLISHGKGHVAVHETGIHGGPPPQVVGAILAVAAVFGIVVLIAEAL